MNFLGEQICSLVGIIGVTPNHLPTALYSTVPTNIHGVWCMGRHNLASDLGGPQINFVIVSKVSLTLTKELFKIKLNPKWVFEIFYN